MSLLIKTSKTSKISNKTNARSGKKDNTERKQGIVIEKIESPGVYENVMAIIDGLMNKGREKTSSEELSEIRRLALLAQEYEKKLYVILAPTTLHGLIEMKMYELHLNQKQLAKKLHISNAKLSLILNGKQKPDIAFLKEAMKELNLDGNVLLNAS